LAFVRYTLGSSGARLRQAHGGAGPRPTKRGSLEPENLEAGAASLLAPRF
jgi:hypothetical protein